MGVHLSPGLQKMDMKELSNHSLRETTLIQTLKMMMAVHLCHGLQRMAVRAWINYCLQTPEPIQTWKTKMARLLYLGRGSMDTKQWLDCCNHSLVLPQYRWMKGRRGFTPLREIVSSPRLAEIRQPFIDHRNTSEKILNITLNISPTISPEEIESYVERWGKFLYVSCVSWYVVYRDRVVCLSSLAWIV